MRLRMLVCDDCKAVHDIRDQEEIDAGYCTFHWQRRPGERLVRCLVCLSECCAIEYPDTGLWRRPRTPDERDNAWDGALGGVGPLWLDMS